MLYDDNDDDDDCLASGLKYSKYSMMAFNKKKEDCPAGRKENSQVLGFMKWTLVCPLWK